MWFLPSKVLVTALALLCFGLAWVRAHNLGTTPDILAKGLCPHGVVQYFGAAAPDGDSEFFDRISMDSNENEVYSVGYTKDTQLNGASSTARPILAHYQKDLVSLSRDLTKSYYYVVEDYEVFVRL